MIKEFFEQEKAVHKYFGYVADWVLIPLEDSTQAYWFIDSETDNEGREVGRVVFSQKPFTVKMIEAGEMYTAEIYTRRFLPKWVYTTDEYTMICIDTRTDGNKYLSIFDNSKKAEPTQEQLDALTPW